MLPDLNLLLGENLHSGVNCANKQRLSLSYNYLAGSLINAATFKSVLIHFLTVDQIVVVFLPRIPLDLHEIKCWGF